MSNVTTRFKIARSASLFVWAGCVLAVPMIGKAPAYGLPTWIALVLGMVLGGLLMFLAMMPEGDWTP